MSDKENVNVLNDEDFLRISSCYVRTTDYFKHFPKSCEKCDDHDICLNLEELKTDSNIIGGESGENKDTIPNTNGSKEEA